MLCQNAGKGRSYFWYNTVAAAIVVVVLVRILPGLPRSSVFSTKSISGVKVESIF